MSSGANLTITTLAAARMLRPQRPPGTLADRVDEVRTNAAEPTDQDLIDAVRRGDPAAFETIYGRYREWVWSLACRMSSDPHTAMDVMQETFLYLLKRVPTLRLSGRLTTFLYPAVKHRSIDAARASKRLHIGSAPSNAAAESPTPASSEDREALVRCVDALPDHEREVLLMRYASEMALSEIAIALGVPLGTVKSRLHAASATLREKLGR